ncbi:glutathione S-transferase [Bimuria novae-zelandiae CBS 107.79]|uniref:Glutathione S-transferase n=1 Tax=Bimuria novae-zelandiae CBS 107.79 TaxID=1447943 RepID=A0A6A5UNM9_9PLEO|nr:glutathione S-transferase [Bimuria novae-zelandiae CBS 107.79]
MSIKPLKIWGKLNGPNPVKARIALQVLGVPFEDDPLDRDQVKSAEYLAINPNGRWPAVYDPNTDITLFETGAIIEYLVDKYDTEQKFSFQPGSKEAYQAKSWLYFQVSGQGPYYGQAVWFKFVHAEKFPSAVQRYAAEVKRVTGVLEEHLEKQKELFPGGDGPWLVGGKFSYADLAWVPWQFEMILLSTRAGLKDDGFDADEFPLVREWIDKMMKRTEIFGPVDAFAKQLAGFFRFEY